MKGFRISQGVLEKLQTKHQVTREEVLQAFLNRTGPSIGDTRANNQTDPPTVWFCALTDRGRTLKVVYMEFPEYFQIKSAFPPTDGSDTLYERICARLP